ncbi:MAG: preprotein translocase subunit YajC [Rickettsiales bacterium]
MTNFLISESLAQATENSTPQTANNFSFASFVPLILIFVIFYFLIIRPQTKKMKEHDLMIKNLKLGNKVITSSGIIGIVRQIHEKENQIELEIAKDVIITILRASISEVEKAEKNEVNQVKSAKKNSKKH